MGALIVLLIVVAAYFLPTFIAWQRKHNVNGVLIVNLLLGWSVIGWVIALVMACGSDKAQQVTVIHQGAPGELPPKPTPLFDPYTGEPVAPPEPLFDPQTGQPLAPAAPQIPAAEPPEQISPPATT